MDMTPEIKHANNLAWKRVHDYQRLKIGGQEVGCPYAINLLSRNVISLMTQAGTEESLISSVTELYKQRQVPYGWYRGKGTPEEIVAAAEALAEVHGYNLANSTAEGIVEFMKLFGLGVDCSGFVYHVLDFAWSAVVGHDRFVAGFAWPSDNQKGVNYAGTQFLAANSSLVEPNDVQPLDLVCIHQDQVYSHIGLILKDDQGWQIVQSNISNLPTGLNVSGLQIKDGAVNFEYKPAIGRAWNDYKDSTIEFRRLSLVNELKPQSDGK